uniref:Uncharacterized protein n=1 Tax=Fagus sylvatica TaxID=28930 RepID=A0A2N9GA56_FAGSY
MGFFFDLTLTLPSISSIFIGEAEPLQNDFGFVVVVVVGGGGGVVVDDGGCNER